VKLHGNARLTPIAREAAVRRVLAGESCRGVAGAVGVSHATVAKWLIRYREEGQSGLQDRSSAPQRCPHRTPAPIVGRIEHLRRKRLTGRAIAEQLRLALSTVSAILRRLGLGRLRALEPRRPAVRYEWPRPGDLVHVDIKPLSRFVRPGHRVEGRGRRPRSRGAGWEYVHVCIDDHSRAAYAEILPDQKGEACGAFLRRALRWFARRGVTVRRVMTDNARAYTHSWAWRDALADHRIQRHILTRFYRPQTNGKAERFIKTLLHEWAYGRAYRSSAQRAAALPNWLTHYNRKRPHGSIGHEPPVTRLRA